MENRKIVIAGGTGFIGRNVAAFFSPGNEVVILTRKVKQAKNNAFEDFESTSLNKNIRLVEWNGKDGGAWEKEIDGCDLIINLAGEVSELPLYTCKQKGNL